MARTGRRGHTDSGPRGGVVFKPINAQFGKFLSPMLKKKVGLKPKITYVVQTSVGVWE